MASVSVARLGRMGPPPILGPPSFKQDPGKHDSSTAASHHADFDALFRRYPSHLKPIVVSCLENTSPCSDPESDHEMPFPEASSESWNPSGSDLEMDESDTECEKEVMSVDCEFVMNECHQKELNDRRSDRKPCLENTSPCSYPESDHEMPFPEASSESWNPSGSDLGTDLANLAAKRIPLAQDLKKLYDSLNVKVENAKEALKAHPNPDSWRSLAENTLAQVSLFNRRRGGDMQRMELQQYQDSITSGHSNQEEVLESLTPFEKKLAEKLQRVEIRGKRGRRVPVLLTLSHKESIDLMIDFREASGISEENKFVFALSSGTLGTSDVLRKCAHDCGAARPDLLTTTSLRKHIGTICQLLNLKDNELDALASFMGHDIRVHRNFYRLPEDTHQVAKVSKVLLLLEKGNISACKGKSLDDIIINEDEEVEFEESDDEEMEGLKDLPLEIQMKETHQLHTKTQGRKTTSRKLRSNEEVEAVKRCLGKYFL
ncbi:hypothetical protein EGW08_001874 [Elysia chlorotica]|uniref:Uncharacterized protein n=1 Tax=Elysia chlorotica TaxID=188477 RepID=A0A3S1A4H1_ELYCH|nr:hypothetical protein EGW08_001874 [Elysia chlorotica]